VNNEQGDKLEQGSYIKNFKPSTLQVFEKEMKMYQAQ